MTQTGIHRIAWTVAGTVPVSKGVGPLAVLSDMPVARVETLAKPDPSPEEIKVDAT